MSEVKHTKPAEFERIVKLDRLPNGTLELSANDAERAALARRFGIPGVLALRAAVTFEPEGTEIPVTGRLEAEIEQTCAVSGETFRNTIDEPLSMRFVPMRPAPNVGEDEEIELTVDELDLIEFEGQAFDLGEAIAQSFGLAIDPFAEGPGAQAARDAGLVSSEAASGPFAALAALKKG